MAMESDNDRVLTSEMEYLAELAAKLNPGSGVGISWSKSVKRYSARAEFTDGFVASFSDNSMSLSLWWLRRYLEMRVGVLEKEKSR